MRRVYKYSLATAAQRNMDEYFVLSMPEGATVLTIQNQWKEPQLWALVETDKPIVRRNFFVVGTGWDIEAPDASYVGTYQTEGGTYVWHLFEAAPVPQ